MSTLTAGPVPAARRVLLSDRVLAAVPLLTVFFWLALIYCWESWGHVTPWLFTDELESAQLSRSIAETGFAARRGEPHGFQSLFNYLIAPAWWFDDTARAYATIKYIGSVTMAAVAFPTYWLARMVVSKPWALFAAAAAAAIPALVYSSFLVDEPLAYPYSALCFFLIAKAIAVRTRGWIGAAIVASAIAPLVRGQLAVIPGVLILAALFRWWGSERMVTRRRDWSIGDYVGALTLTAGAVIFLNAFISHHSYAWLVSTLFYKGRMIDYGLWAAGAFTIGVGVFPVIAGLASLFPPRGVGQTEGERAYRCVAFAGLGLVGFYTAVKAAYISTVFSTLVEERNLIYVAPLLFVGTALVLERRRVRWTAALAAGALVLYLIKTTPYHIDEHFYFDAPGLAILQGANQKFSWTAGYAENVLIGMLVVSLVVLALPRAMRWLGPRPAAGAMAAVAVGVLAWNLTGQITGSTSSKYFSELYSSNIAKPLDWLDRANGGAPTLYLGQNITDPTGIQELEFWNRSIDRVWSLDGSAGLVGAPTLSPDLGEATGRLHPQPKGAKFVVADEGLDIDGVKVARHRHLVGGGGKDWVLWKINPPLRLRHSASGLYDDGWSREKAAYSQYTTPGNKAGWVTVILSRPDGFDFRNTATIKVGTLIVGPDKQAATGRVTGTRRAALQQNSYVVLYLRTPKPPFRITVTIDPPLVPAELDPRTGDIRKLGAQLSFQFRDKLPPGAQG
ncbi:MAG: hypothetical protein M3540_11235 [Actinomycetota bacterium]|nr:hypothetical protein [Actinomycetota bacterium]